MICSHGSNSPLASTFPPRTARRACVLNVHWKMILDGDYNGVADFAMLPTYFDPNPFLDPFLAPDAGNPSGWTDPAYSWMLKDANRTLNPMVDRPPRGQSSAG